MYETLLIIHITAIAIWFGGGLALNVIATRTPPPDRPAVAPQIGFYGSRVLPVAGLLTMLSGFGLISELDLSAGDRWLVIGLLLWAGALGIGAGIASPTAKKLGELAAAPGPPDLARMGALRTRLLTASRIALALMLLAIIDMVAKPGL